MKRKILLLMMTALLSVGAWATEIWNAGHDLNWNYFTLPKISMTAGDVLTFHITSVGADWSVMDLYTTGELKEGSDWDHRDTRLMSLDHRSGSNVIVVVTDDIASAAPDGIIVYGENHVVVSSVDYEKKPSSYNLFSGEKEITWSSEQGLSSAPFAGVRAGDLLKIEISAVSGVAWGDDVQLRSSSWGGDETILKSDKAYSATTVTFEFDDDLVTAAKTNGLYIRGNSFTMTSVDIVYAPTVNISAGYATLGFDESLDLTGIEAYTAAVSGDKVVLTSVKGKKIPAGTGIILKGSGNVTIPLTTETPDNITGNDLLVSDGTVTGDKNGTIYVLANGDDGVGFYPVVDGSAITAGKAYLKVDDGAARQFIGFGDDNGATGIDSLTPALSKGEEVYYDLQGRRVAQPTKGLYIVNGKKVVIK